MTVSRTSFWPWLRNRASGVVASFVGSARAVLTATVIGNANRWREGYNPLRGQTIAGAALLVESWDRGEFADLMWLYRWIERSDATLSAVLNRREASLTKLDWEIKTVDSDDLPGGITEAMVEAQQEALRAAYERIDNLREAIAHLALADFRGFSFVEKQSVHGDEVDHLECVDHWNLMRDGLRGPWYYNPTGMQRSARQGEEALRLEPRNFVHLTCERHVDFVALFCVLRKSLGQKDWAAFVEGFGLNPTIIIGPPGMPEGKEADFQAGAEAVAAHGSGSLPNGSSVHYANSEKGAQPFADFIKAQDSDIVLAGTSGKLTMLAESGSGTLAGGAHQDTFDELAKGHAQRISEAFQRDFDRPLLEALFPGQPVLAYFELCANEETNVGEVVKDVAALATAGFVVKPEQIEEKTGYEVSLKPAQPIPGMPGTERRAMADGPGADPLRPGIPHPESPEDSPGDRMANRAADPVANLRAAMRGDLKDLARRVRNLAAIQDEGIRREKLTALRAELPGLLRDLNADPAAAAPMAALIERSLAAGAGQAESQPR